MCQISLIFCCDIYFPTSAWRILMPWTYYLQHIGEKYRASHNCCEKLYYLHNIHLEYSLILGQVYKFNQVSCFLVSTWLISFWNFVLYSENNWYWVTLNIKLDFYFFIFGMVPQYNEKHFSSLPLSLWNLMKSLVILKIFLS